MSNVVELATRRKTWTPIAQVDAVWTLDVRCPWCKAHFTIGVHEAVDRPVYPPCCDGAPLAVLAARLPGAAY